MPEINEGFAQLSEQLMLVAGLAYAVAFCAYAWDLFTFSQAAKKGLATEAGAGQASGEAVESREAALAGAGARGAAGQGSGQVRRTAACVPAAKPMQSPTA